MADTDTHTVQEDMDQSDCESTYEDQRARLQEYNDLGRPSFFDSDEHRKCTLRDYQMQLMLQEQQSAQRRRMQSDSQESMAHQSDDGTEPCTGSAELTAAQQAQITAIQQQNDGRVGMGQQHGYPDGIGEGMHPQSVLSPHEHMRLQQQQRAQMLLRMQQQQQIALRCTMYQPETSGPPVGQTIGHPSESRPNSDDKQPLSYWQGQLALLEQQNKKRLLMAKQSQDSMSHPGGCESNAPCFPAPAPPPPPDMTACGESLNEQEQDSVLSPSNRGLQHPFNNAEAMAAQQQQLEQLQKKLLEAARQLWDCMRRPGAFSPAAAYGSYQHARDYQKLCLLSQEVNQKRGLLAREQHLYDVERNVSESSLPRYPTPPPPPPDTLPNSDPRGPWTEEDGKHRQQDYQMQLMLLEQQNKKRLLKARQEQDEMQDSGEFDPNGSDDASRPSSPDTHAHGGSYAAHEWDPDAWREHDRYNVAALSDTSSVWSSSPQPEHRIEHRHEPTKAALPGLEIFDGYTCQIDGLIYDEDGNTIGRVTEGDPSLLQYATLNKEGEFIDEEGDVVGYAEIHEEAADLVEQGVYPPARPGKDAEEEVEVTDGLIDEGEDADSHHCEAETEKDRSLTDKPGPGSNGSRSSSDSTVKAFGISVSSKEVPSDFDSICWTDVEKASMNQKRSAWERFWDRVEGLRDMPPRRASVLSGVFATVCLVVFVVVCVLMSGVLRH